MGVGALIDMERKGCESIIHGQDCDLWVTMVGWVDVPYSDCGDFRRRRAVDIPSWFQCFDNIHPSGLLTHHLHDRITTQVHMNYEWPLLDQNRYMIW